jgi:hypothetical protein
MTCLWGIILGSTLLYSLKDSSNFCSYLGFILLPLDNTIAESLFQSSDFKLDTFIYGGFFYSFPPKKSRHWNFLFLGVSFLWVWFAGCNIIGELLFNGCATVLAKCFWKLTMDSEEPSKGQSTSKSFCILLLYMIHSQNLVAKII